MEEIGYILFVLNTHQPYVREPGKSGAMAEEWLFEAITESYIPLIDMCQRLYQMGVRSNLTISLSPCLAWMLQDPLRCERYPRYLEKRIDYLCRSKRNRGYDTPLGRVLQMHEEHYRRCQFVFEEMFRGDLISGFRQLYDAGAIAMLTSAGTHPYLPLWSLYPETVQLQLAVAVKQFGRDFGRPPRGIWLPECGYFDGLDHLLAENGLQYFFADRHGLLNGDPQPCRKEFAPIHTAAGVAAFGRDWSSHDRVWLKEGGYPGDPIYLDVWGPDLSSGLKEPPPSGIHVMRGTKHTGWTVYEPAEAKVRSDVHAKHFINCCEHHITEVGRQLDRQPCLVALFDTEHFGHWWYEGPRWLERVILLLNEAQSKIRLVTPEQYLSRYPTNQRLTPSMSSWGYQGYSETWLMGDNHWIYPPLFDAADRLKDMISPANTNPIEPAFLDQYIRELMLAQSSDWPFMMHVGTTVAYARARVLEHIANMECIRSQKDSSAYNWRWLDAVRERNKVFGEIDLCELYRGIVRGADPTSARDGANCSPS